MYHVLIIETNPMAQKLLEIFISTYKQYSLVPSLNSVRQAVPYCTDHTVDLILLDLAAVHDGKQLETVKELKKQFPAVKIIAITDLPEYSYIDKARQIGVESFWYKEPEAASLLYIMDRTMAGDSVYPQSTPVMQLGNALSIDFTERELEVLREVVSGKTDADIAQKLKLSVSTVKFHIQKIREKTGFTTRTELAVRTRESGLIISQQNQ